METQISEVINKAISQCRIVGSDVLVSKSGKIVYRSSDGFFDREKNIPMKEDAIFRIASVTKLYVAVATMILVAKGKISLESVVSDYLPYFRPSLVGEQAPEITIRQLLNHTSGLSYGFLETETGPLHQARASDGMDIVEFSLEENLKRIATAPLIFEPGTQWLYSLSFDVLGAILEKIEEKDLSTIIHHLITNPLGLIDTGFNLVDTDRLAPAYMNSSSAPKRMEALSRVPAFEGMAPILMDPNRALFKNAFPSGGAGMVGSPHDLLKLLEVLRTGGGSLLPLTLVQEMGKNQIKNLPVAGWPGWGHGLGFSVLKNEKEAQTEESVGTWRWGGAYGHSWFVDHEKELVVVAFTNTSLEGMSGGGQFPFEIRNAVINAFK